MRDSFPRVETFDYYCCRLGDVILHGDLRRTGLKSRSHAIDSAYIEMKSLAVCRSNRSFALEFVESNIIGHVALLDRDSGSIDGPYRCPI